jgi:hypothetical protein
MKTSTCKAWISLTLIASPGIYIPSAFSQSDQAASSHSGPVGWAVASNKWRLTPALSASEGDTVSPSVRAERNSYLEPRLKLAANFTSPFVSMNYNRPIFNPSVDTADGALWIVGTFKSMHVYAADNAATLLYTEVNLHVDKVIYQSPQNDLKAASMLDVVEFGGRLQTRDGVIHSSLLEPKMYSLQPEHQYILDLIPGSGGFYVVDREWDITGGTVLTSSPVDEQHVREGKPQIVGLSQDAAVTYIQSAIQSAIATK